MSHLDYKLLIFDWDGTLANSIGRIVESMHMASTRLKLAQGAISALVALPPTIGWSPGLPIGSDGFCSG